MKLTLGVKYNNWLNNHKIEASIKECDEIDKLIKNKEYDKAYEFFKKRSKENEINIPDDVKSFFQTIKDLRGIKASKTEIEEIPEEIQEAISFWAEGMNSDKIYTKYAKKLNYSQLKILTNYIYNQHRKLIFLITPQDKLEGRIVTSTDSFETLEIAKGFYKKPKKESDTGVYKTSIYGEFLGNVKGLKALDSLRIPFHEYIFQAKNGIRFYLYSETPLKLGRCEIVGQIIPIMDSKRIGDEAKTRKVIEIIFPYSIDYNTHKLTPEEITKIRSSFCDKGKTQKGNLIGEALFGKRRHPEWFEKLIFAIISNRKGFALPAHLLVIGNPGTGKTTGILKSLQISLDEMQGMISGNGSTLKALIPSYKETPPSSGWLSEADRIALVDEFFQFIAKGETKPVEGGDYFAELKDILEGHEKTGKSGNSNKAIKYQMTSTMIAVTNPQKAHGMETVMDFSQRFDAAFCSRMILYKINPDHEQMIFSNQPSISFGKDMNEEKAFPKKNDDFINLMDYLNEDVFVQVNPEKITTMINKLKRVAPSDLQPVMVRYNNIIANVLGGVSKYRWLSGEKETFKIDDIDYELVEDIFFNVIASWCIDDKDMLKLPEKARISLLDEDSRQLWDLMINRELYKIKDYGDVKNYLENFSEIVFGVAIAKLKKTKLLKLISLEGIIFIVPYWYKYGDEIKQTLSVEEEII